MIETITKSDFELFWKAINCAMAEDVIPGDWEEVGQLIFKMARLVK